MKLSSRQTRSLEVTPQKRQECAKKKKKRRILRSTQRGITFSASIISFHSGLLLFFFQNFSLLLAVVSSMLELADCWAVILSHVLCFYRNYHTPSISSAPARHVFNVWTSRAADSGNINVVCDPSLIRILSLFKNSAHNADLQSLFTGISLTVLPKKFRLDPNVLASEIKDWIF